MADLLKRIESKDVQVAVVGLGYVGLPLAVEFARAGLRTVGIDTNADKVQKLNAGKSYIPDVAGKIVKELVGDGLLSATTDYDVLEDVDCVSVCVPTPLRKTKDPDISYILSAADEIARTLHEDMLIVLESTTYPGTTEEVFLPRISSNNLKVGEDVFVAFSPERVDPGNETWQTRNTPKVIGGVTARCAEAAAALYRHAVEEIVLVSSATVAEMVKLLENTFRMVNIGLVNEMALICDRLGVNVWEVVEAAATKPFGFMKFTPGPGLGGHCIPIDPLYLSWKMKELQYTARFIELASEINANMPRYIVGKITDALNTHGKPLKGSKVLILGAAYKRDVDDVRESPALDIITLLEASECDVSFHDPHVPHISSESWSLERVPDLMAAVRSVDCVVIVTDHSGYDWPGIVEHASLIVDSRNAVGSIASDEGKIFGL
ncbi:MAG TPA: nucleotide sugar dehydrogenase [Anaerolineae bacterium]|nr:nucleotide sugar dehydrogenase [Anaerolineae bacterium]